MNLYALTAAYQAALDGITVDPETGELLGGDALDAMADALEDKLESVALYIKGLAAETVAIKDEEAMLCERRRTLERKNQRLRAYLADAMTAAGLPKLDTPRTIVSFRKSSEVVISDMAALPDAFRRVKIEPDKTAIKAAYKVGSSVPGAAVVEKQNIQIK